MLERKMEKLSMCQVCGEGQLVLRVTDEDVEYGGQTARVAVRMVSCDHCGSEYATPAEALLNKRAVMAFRKRVDGLLSGEEIRFIRRQYDISQDQASAMFGGGPKAFSKYENDDVAHATSMDKLLRLVRDSEDAFHRLASQADLGPEMRLKSLLAKFVWDPTTSVTVGASNDDAFLANTQTTQLSTVSVCFDNGGLRKWS
jgi:HTH-type transcriptional regulator / antitoxin MqsA